jgi:hypothetical protein
MELPVITPGVEESTRKLRDFHGAVTQSYQGAQQHVQGQKEMVQSLQQTGENTERAMNKFKELGGELRRSAPEIGHLMRDMVSEFGPILFAVEGIKEAFNFLGETSKQVFGGAIEEIKSLGDAMLRAHDVIGGARNRQGEGGAAYLNKNGSQLGAMLGQGGNALLMAAELSKHTGIDVERVNYAVLKGKQSGMTDAEITNSVKAAAFVEISGHGKFDTAADAAASLAKFSHHNLRHPEDNYGLLDGSPAEVASRLINAKSVEEWATPAAVAARNAQTGRGKTRIYQEKDAWRRQISSLQEQGRYDEAEAMEATGFQSTRGRFGGQYNPDIDRGGIPGTSAAQLETEGRRIIGNPLYRGINDARHDHADMTIMEQRNALVNGPRAVRGQRQGAEIEERFPGLTSLVENVQKDQQEWLEKARQRRNLTQAFQDQGINIDAPETAWFMNHIPGGPEISSDEEMVKASDKLRTDRQAISRSFPQASAAELSQMVKTLISIDAKMGRISEGTAPK